MKHAAMSVAASVLNAIGGQPISALYRGRGHILMFHRLQPSSSEPRIFANAYLEVTPAYLQQTIDYFDRHGYAFLHIADIPAFLREERSGRRFVAYTFDDGFRDNLELGLPIFHRNRVPVAINITTGFPDHQVMLWWNELERLLLVRDEIEISIGDARRRFPLRDSREKMAAFRAVSGWLKNTEGGTLAQRVSDMLAPFGVDPLDEVRRLSLSWDDIRALASEPLVTLGAHTVSHPVLAKLDETSARGEIVEGRRRLEAEIGRPVTHFAYPFGGPGEVGQREIDFVADAGYQLALTTYSSNVQRGHLDHLLSLPRVAVGMSMTEATLDLVRHGVIPMLRNGGRRLVTMH